MLDDPSPAVTTNAQWKTLELSWSGGTTNAEPSGWQNVGFNDSSWFPAYIPTDPYPQWVDIAGADWLSSTGRAAGHLTSEVWIARVEFTLPTEPSTNGTLTWNVDNAASIWVNGQEIVTNSGNWNAVFTTVVPIASLHSGTNAIAIKVFNGPENANDWCCNPTMVQASLSMLATGAMGSEASPAAKEFDKNNQSSKDPVGTAWGNFQYSFTDVAIKGRGPAPAFTRSYDSGETRVGPFGQGWTHTYATRLRHPGDGSEDVYFVGADGSSDRYVHNPDDSFVPPAAVFRTLVHNPNGTYTAREVNQSSWTFDPAGNLITVTDPYGNASSLGYNAQGQLSSISDPAGRGSLTLAYTNGKITSLTDWATPVRTVVYDYDPSGRLWKVTNREGKTTTFGYDGTSSRLTTITDALLHVAVTMTYDAQGRVATQKDAQGLATGAVTTFGYVVNGDGTRVTTITYPATSFEPSFSPTVVDSYNAAGWIASRVSRPTSTETLTESYTYDSTGIRTAFTDARSNTTDYCYDVSYSGTAIVGSRGNLTRRIDPAPVAGAVRPVTLYAYDSHNNPTQVVAPKGVPSGTTETCSTDLSAVNLSYATDLAYDASFTKLLSTTQRYTDPDTGAKTATTKFEYTDAANPGRVTRVIPPRGNTAPTPDYTYATTFSYGAPGTQAGMLVGSTDALGNTITTTYDSVGRTTAVVDQLGNAAGGVPADHTTNYVYDKEDRVRFVKLPSPTAGGSQLVTESRYDDVGNRTVQIDALAQVTTYAFDVRDGLFQVKESPNAWTNPLSPPAGVVSTEYSYDAAGNLARMTRAKGDAANERVTDYAYDGRDLVRRETQYPAWPTSSPTLVTTSGYDPNGNPTTVVDPLGQTTTSAFDRLNRLTGIDYSAVDTPDVAYGYDAQGNRTSMTDGTGATTYLYDEADRLTSLTSPGPKTVGYRYDLDGNRTKLIYPDDTAVTYSFNKASQLASLQDWASRSVAYTYRPDGSVKTATNPDASVATYTYDNARRVIDLLHQKGSTTITHHAYTLDPVGNVTGLQEYVAGITQGAWSAGVKINDDTGGAAQIKPDLAVGPDGAAMAVWWDSRTDVLRDIYASRRDPVSGIWGANQRVNDVTTDAQSQASIAIGPNNDAYAVWLDSRNGRVDVYFSKRSATTGIWGANVRVNSVTNFTNQINPAIAVSSTGEAIAVWYRLVNNKRTIFSARLPAGSSTWSAEMKVSTDTSTGKANPDIAIGPTGIAYAAWTQGSGDSDIWFASLPSGSSTWAASTKVSDDPGTAQQDSPKVGVDGAGIVTAVWSDQRTFPFQLRARRRSAAGVWSASVVVAADGANQPSLSVRSDGKGFLAWDDGSNIRSSEFDPATSTWSSPLNLNDGAAGPCCAAAAIGASTENVVWESGGADVYGRSRSANGGGTGTDTFTYGYDRLYRLTTVTGPDGAPTYGYDPVGNRTSKVLAGTTTYTYDRADRISAAGALSMTVNANGNTTAKGADTFTYDQPNRLKTATVAGTTETYAYDGDGIRFSRQVGVNPVIRYVSDMNTGLEVTIDDGSRKYVWGLGLAYAVNGATLEVYHTDRLGSVRAITDATGILTAAYRMDEFGVSTLIAGSSTQPLRFTGEPRDVSGLTYLRARYYDPGLGRFQGRDVFGGVGSSPLSLNRYTYVHNNPATWTDPSGYKSGVLSGNSAGLCANFQGGVSAYAGISGCFTKDDTGRRALLVTYTFGGVLAFTGSSTLGIQLSNGRIADLQGVFGVSGGSVGEYYVAGMDVSYGPGLKVIAVQLSAGFTLKLPVPAEGHSGISNTIVLIDDPVLLDQSRLAPVWATLDALLLAQSLAP